MPEPVEHDPLCPSDMTCQCGMVHKSYTCQCDLIRAVRRDDARRFSENLQSGFEAVYEMGWADALRKAQETASP